MPCCARTGTHIGTQTNYFFEFFLSPQVIAVEANPQNAHLLRMNVAVNGREGAVAVVEKCASHQNGLVRFVKYRYNSGQSSVLDRPVSNSPHQFIDVIAAPADQIIADAGVAPMEIGFVWIDVEGHEVSVLRGMRQILAHQPPLLVEFTRDKIKDQDFAYFRDEVVARYERIRAFELGFDDIPMHDLDLAHGRFYQYNLLLT